MFGFLKDKLKKAVQIFTKATTEETPKDEPKEIPKKPQAPKKPEPQKKEPVKQVQKTPEKKETPKPSLPKKPEVPKSAPAPKPVEHEIPKSQPETVQKITTAPAVAEQPKQETILAPQEKRGFFDKLLGKKEVKPAPVEQILQKPALQEKPEEKTGFFDKIKAAVTTKKISREEFNTLFEDLEIGLLENNVALEVVDKMKEDLWEGISGERLSRFAPEERVHTALKESIEGLFMEPFDVLNLAKKKEIYVICAVGINGSGKTTTLAKMAQYFKDNKLEPVLAAADTFRAAAIQQLEEHANKIGVKIIKQQYGADAAAVAYDAIQYAKANKCRVVLIDTAGRLHSNTNLMEEMRKIIRVANPDCTLFIGEATTGNDCVEQAVQFQAAVPIDGIVLSKVDVDERGGAALSISYVTKKPIIFFGTGQTYKDLEPFDKKRIMENLEL